MGNSNSNSDALKRHIIIFIVLSLGVNLIFAGTYSPRSLYGSIPGGDLQSVWNNPAMIGQLETGDKGGLYLELHNDFRYDPNIAVGINFDIGSDLCLGFASNSSTLSSII
ncbi:MAG: hypothetical protein U5N56_02880 [Candidatus Marinimicrobia bacterium]|nr:hypothetical protein [Candidatus Neomarinimicrobiota bacterium]